MSYYGLIFTKEIKVDRLFVLGEVAGMKELTFVLSKVNLES